MFINYTFLFNNLYIHYYLQKLDIISRDRFWIAMVIPNILQTIQKYQNYIFYHMKNEKKIIKNNKLTCIRHRLNKITI